MVEGPHAGRAVVEEGKDSYSAQSVASLGFALGVARGGGWSCVEGDL